MPSATATSWGRRKSRILVTADLAASWQKALRARVPHARVVFDRFHVEQLASDAVDEVRRAEQRGADAKTAKTLKGTRYCLLKHPARLKSSEKRRLAALRRQNRALDRAYELKEYLATILEQGKPGEASKLLDEWLTWAKRAVALGAVRQAGAHDPQACCRDPRLPRHPDDERAGRGHQQQAARNRAPRIRIPLPRRTHLDALPLLWRYRTDAAPTHTCLRRLVSRSLADPGGRPSPLILDRLTLREDQAILLLPTLRRDSRTLCCP